MTELPDNIDVQKSIIFFKIVLREIADLASKQYPQDMKNTLKQKLAEMMWDNLPKHVVTIDLGDQLSVTRPEDQTKYLPLDQKETWGLPQIDIYASRLSQSILLEWKPIFPSPQSTS